MAVIVRESLPNPRKIQVKDLQKLAQKIGLLINPTSFVPHRKKPEVEVVESQEAPISLASWSGVEFKQSGEHWRK